MQGGVEIRERAGASSGRSLGESTEKSLAGVKHVRGIVSMAHGDDPDSATTSFFIVLGPSPHLDGTYAAFGEVVEGIEVLDAFEKEEVDGETPKRRLEIIEATID